MMLSRDVCRIHSCVQVHARRGEQERKMWLVLSLLLLGQHLCYSLVVTATGDLFVPSLDVLQLQATWDSGEWIRSCISPLCQHRRKEKSTELRCV
jgi:hypothetical protein